MFRKNRLISKNLRKYYSTIPQNRQITVCYGMPIKKSFLDNFKKDFFLKENTEKNRIDFIPSSFISENNNKNSFFIPDPHFGLIAYISQQKKDDILLSCGPILQENYITKIDKSIYEIEYYINKKVKIENKENQNIEKFLQQYSILEKYRRENLRYISDKYKLYTNPMYTKFYFIIN